MGGFRHLDLWDFHPFARISSDMKTKMTRTCEIDEVPCRPTHYFCCSPLPALAMQWRAAMVMEKQVITFVRATLDTNQSHAHCSPNINVLFFPCKDTAVFTTRF